MTDKETSRTEAFSDGVFAIAITLLILEIKVPTLSTEISNNGLLNALLSTWPSFLAYGVSFLAILVMWVNHHGLFNLIYKVDKRFLFANGFLLFFITFVPFPTAVLAEYLNTSAANIAVVQYCGTYIGICIAYNLLWYTASFNRRLIKPEVSNMHINKIRYAYGIAFFVYMFATIISFYKPTFGLVLNSSLWVLWAILGYRPR